MHESQKNKTKIPIHLTVRQISQHTANSPTLCCLTGPG